MKRTRARQKKVAADVSSRPNRRQPTPKIGVPDAMDDLDEAICIITTAEETFLRHQDLGRLVPPQAALRALQVGASKLRKAQHELDEALAVMPT